ncbi:MAG: hypothetical protein JWQ23_2085 [Herminiimonas sp.]|nr:hypothetical protein [Herminiimonas sp.]
MRDLRDRLSVVILTHNRALELRRTLENMLALPCRPALVVVDNASTDTTADLLRRDFPRVRLIAMPCNGGAAARNVAVQGVPTPYVAFCDDDSWWADGSLEQAVGLLDSHPRVAAVCARILLGPEEIEDPVCARMASSPLPSAHLPGPALLGFIACAVVFRRQAFLDAGGYDPKFFVGGEEELLTLDLVANGWSIVYAAHMTVHHYPSPRRDSAARQKIVIRNALWVAWLRMPWGAAMKATWRICRPHPRKVWQAALWRAMHELPWVWRKRKVSPVEVQHWYRTLQTRDAMRRAHD